MTWPAYTEYKESDVEWIGAIPCDWSVRPLRYICDVQTGDRDTVHRVDDGEYPFFIRSENVQRIDTWSMDGEAVLTPGDGAVGQVFHYYVGKFDYHQRVYAFFNFRAVSGRYFYYYLSALFAKVALDGSAKTTVDSLRMPLIKGFMIAHPGLLAQEQIVRFLDRETAKIDALIDKQEQLIATLREDRAATITHAVTRGLSPETHLKETGTRWIDALPQHWIFSRLSRHVSINSGQVDPRNEPYREMILIAPNHVESGTGRLIETETADEQAADSGKYRVTAGQVIYSKIRPNLAKVTIAPVDCLCSADMYGLSTDQNELASGFLMYELLSQPFTDYVIDSSMRVAMPKVNHESLGAAPIWIPPIEEQHAVVKFLDARCANIDALIIKSLEMIETLHEYRSALIANAVTGKIDVREAV